MPKLGKFPIFDNFLDLANFLLFNFPDLDNFQDLNKFWLFNFSNFLAIFTSLLPTLNLITLLLLFLISGLNISSDLAIFSIEVSGAIILLKS